jgi:ABC-type multidrug transport system ATPase subunit
VELIKNPSVLFLDEPTSGLDSFQAQSVMSAMRNLSENGRTVVASIHQPRSSIYLMFDQLLLLAEGKCLFFGPATDAVSHFAAQGHKCPTNYVRSREGGAAAYLSARRRVLLERAPRRRVLLRRKRARAKSCGSGLLRSGVVGGGPPEPPVRPAGSHMYLFF